MARRIQGSLHGAGLNPAGHVTAGSTGGWVGPVTGIPTPDHSWQQIKAHLPSGPVTPTSGYLKISTPVTDSERMIQMLDLLVSQFSQLSSNAANRLEQFCVIRPDVDVAKQMTDARQCESSYFRILESRIEMLTESMNYLNGLINSVSAPSQGAGIQSAGSLGSTLKSH